MKNLWHRLNTNRTVTLPIVLPPFVQIDLHINFNPVECVEWAVYGIAAGRFCVLLRQALA